eukprot:6399153-Amphidinium_carterae.2
MFPPTCTLAQDTCKHPHSLPMTSTTLMHSWKHTTFDRAQWHILLFMTSGLRHEPLLMSAEVGDCSPSAGSGLGLCIFLASK